MKITPNFSDHDAFYEQLLAAHEGLTEAQSAQLNARLILLLANQVGEQKVLADCIAAARDTLRAGEPRQSIPDMNRKTIPL